MKKFKQYIVGALLLPLLLGSCTSNFEEYNTDPNRPTTLDAAALIPQSDRLPRIARGEPLPA